jgi:hypothetical protein
MATIEREQQARDLSKGILKTWSGGDYRAIVDRYNLRTLMVGNSFKVHTIRTLVREQLEGIYNATPELQALSWQEFEEESDFRNAVNAVMEELRD